jgi:hypothetical protein
MKVIVYYANRGRRIIDVDDKFYKLSDTGGYETLPDSEKDSLTNDLLDKVVELTGISFHSIFSVETENNEVLVDV